MPIKIYVISLIIIFSKNHYQNRMGKSPSTRRAAAPKIFGILIESLGVRSTRGSVRLPIGVFDCLLCAYCLSLLFTVRLALCIVCKRF